MHRCLFFMLLLTVLLLTGCHSRSGDSFLTAQLSPSPTLQGSKPVPDSKWTLTLFADLEIRNNKEYTVVKVAMAMQKPSCLRVETLPPIGPPFMYLTLQGDVFHVYLPQKKEFLRGNLSSKRLYDYLPLPEAIPLDNLAALLMGSPFPEFFQSGNGDVTLPAGESFPYRQESLTGYIYSIWLNRDSLPGKLVIEAKMGNPIGVIHWKDYQKVGLFAVPHLIQISSGAWDLTAHYRDVRLTTEIHSNLFLLEIPNGLTPTYLEPQRRE